jgi:hypothetical protein
MELCIIWSCNMGAIAPRLTSRYTAAIMENCENDTCPLHNTGTELAPVLKCVESYSIGLYAHVMASVTSHQIRN